MLRRRIFLILPALVFSYTIYSLLTVTLHNGKEIPKRGDWLRDLSSFDPIIPLPRHAKKSDSSKAPFHVVVTAKDDIYSRWQMRIMYYWFKKVKNRPGSSMMGGFTRILHSGKPDNLMEEIPTFVVDPLPDGLDRGYVVLNRPWAFMQFLEKAVIKEDYIMMAEPDHIFLNPLPNLAHSDFPAGYPFFYIKPIRHEKILRKYYPVEKGPVTSINPIGNSPVIIKKTQLMWIAPTWLNVSVRMKYDAETDKAFGWVLEMYGFAVASALHNVQYILRRDFMVQTPWDPDIQNAFILHYTYSMDYTLKGELLYHGVGGWRFNKRFYFDCLLPRNLSMPPLGVPKSVWVSTRCITSEVLSPMEWTKLDCSTFIDSVRMHKLLVRPESV